MKNIITNVKEKGKKPLTIFEIDKVKRADNKVQEPNSLLVDKERELKNKGKDKGDFLFPLKTLFS